jgi:serine protease Do
VNGKSRVFFRAAAGMAAAVGIFVGVPRPVAAGEAPFVGMQIQGVSPEVAGALGLGGAAGVLVRDVALGGPADAAGFRRGDLIVEFAGKPVQSFEHLVALVGALAPGASADATVQREGGVRAKLSLKAGEWPDAWRDSPGKFAVLPDLGLTFSSITSQVRQQFGVRWGSTGVLVTLVDEAKVLAVGRPVDLKRGEIVVQVNQRPVWQPDQVLAAYAEARKAGRTTLLLLVEGEEGSRNGFHFSLLPVK